MKRMVKFSLTLLALALCLIFGSADAAMYVSVDGHVVQITEVYTYPTCGSTGQGYGVCVYCGAEGAVTIPALDEHSWGSWTVVTAATCQAAGQERRVCSECGTTQTRTTSASGHDYGPWNVTAQATCTTTGSQSRTCRLCGHVDSQTVSPLPHSYGAWTLINEATDHSSGVRSHTCSVCGHQDTESYAPQGTLRRGDTGDDVAALQAGLICYGALTGSADGSFGAGTESAVRQVQSREGFTVDGIAWPQTINVLGHQFGEWQELSQRSDFSIGLTQRTCDRCGYVQQEKDVPTPMYQRGDKGDEITTLQLALNAAGYDCGAADGSFGGKTENAVKQLEAAHGVTADGIAWPGVLRLLGLLPDNTALSAESLALNTSPRGSLDQGFAAGDVLSFDVYVSNESAQPLLSGRIEMRVNGRMATGQVLTGFERESDHVKLDYTIRQADVDAGQVTIVITGVAQGEDQVFVLQDVTFECGMSE